MNIVIKNYVSVQLIIIVMLSVYAFQFVFVQANKKEINITKSHYVTRSDKALPGIILSFLVHYRSAMPNSGLDQGLIIYIVQGSYQDAVNDFKKFRPRRIQQNEDLLTGQLASNQIIKVRSINGKMTKVMLAIEATLKGLKFIKRYFYYMKNEKSR